MMFTGIVEAVGRVAEATDRDDARRIRIEAPADFASGLAVGCSVALDGACLTAVEVQPAGFSVDIVGTTLARTVAGGYGRGSLVNLERALAVGDRLDGHLVQGHVDGIGHVTDVRDNANFKLMRVSIPAEVHVLTVEHGSITLNGVSLTVSRLEEDGVEVALIPHTWESTNFRHLSSGDPVNVEGDLIGKYVGKLLRHNVEGLRGGSTDAL